jgi:tetratricopeptide (TPR) repeat protein
MYGPTLKDLPELASDPKDRDLLESFYFRCKIKNLAEAYYWWALVKNQYGLLTDARDYLHQALTIDPYYKNAYNALAYLYLNMEDYENALWACNMYISIAPDEANPYDTRGDVYSRMGEIEKAIESYLKTMELKPFYGWTYSKLVDLYQLSREYDQAIYWLEKGWANEHDIPVPAVIYATIFAAQGKINEALEILDKRLELIESGVETISTKGRIIKTKALFLAEKDPDAAIEELESISDLIDEDTTNTKFEYYYNYIFTLAGERRFNEAESLSVILEKLNDGSDEFEQKYDYLTGYTEYQKGNYEKAISVFEQAVGDELPYEGFVGKYLLSLAYLKAGRSGDAANLLERLLKSTDYERVSYPLFSAGIHFYLAQAYDSLGEQKLASEQYREFLDIWDDADEWLKDNYNFDAIRERINRLES